MTLTAAGLLHWKRSPRNRRAPIPLLPSRDRFSSASRSVQFWLETGSAPAGTAPAARAGGRGRERGPGQPRDRSRSRPTRVGSHAPPCCRAPGQAAHRAPAIRRVPTETESTGRTTGTTSCAPPEVDSRRPEHTVSLPASPARTATTPRDSAQREPNSVQNSTDLGESMNQSGSPDAPCAWASSLRCTGVGTRES